MSVEIKPSAIRAVDAYKKLQAAHAEAAKKILELDMLASDLIAKLHESKAILDSVFGEDGGESMGGDNRGTPVA